MPNDKRRGMQIPINPTTWHDNEELDQAIDIRLARLIRYGRLDVAKIQGRPDLFINDICELLAGCVATMPVVLRAMQAAHPELDRIQCVNEAIKKMGELFGVSADSMIGGLQPNVVESGTVFYLLAIPRRTEVSDPRVDPLARTMGNCFSL
jgi:hypothetical protein